MVGKNNHIRTVKSNLKKHYKSYKAGRRWVYASLASLALGAGLLLGSTTSYADTTTATAQEPTSVKTSDTAATEANQKASTVPLKTGTDSNTTNQSSTANTSDNTTSNTNKNATESVKATDTTSANVGKKAEKLPATKSDVNTNTSDSSTPVASTPTSSTTPANTSEAKPATTSKTLVDPTDEQLNAAKAKAAQVYATTHQPQEIDAVAPDSQASLKISTNAIGYGTGATPPLTVTLTTNAKAGDVYTITIPANTRVFSYQSAAHLVSAAGTTTETTNADGSHTITDTFTADSTTTQQIKMDIGGNYAGQPAGMPDVGKTVTKTITWTINKQAQTPVTFTQTIKPTTKLSTVSLLYPNSQAVSTILPNKNYVFGISVNEANGIRDDSWVSAKVNSADNYGGSKITIPVPTGFVLDENSTSQINGLTDGTTIAQPGGKGTDVIINAPAKAGNQGYQEVPPYKIVGAFDVPQTDTNQTLTANGDVTFSQIVNSDNDTITDKADPWSVKLIANNGGTDVGNSTAAASGRGNATGTNKFVLDTDSTDDPAYLASFGFAYNSAADSSNTQFKITVPDGLDATGIQVPASTVSPTVYLPDMTSYTYTLTLADGTTETGTVNAGDKVTSNDNAAIRTAVFVPNKLAPGANTGDDNQLGGKYSFVVNGHLSSTYDDGTPVKDNDQLVTTFNAGFDASGKQISSEKSITQTVVEAESLGVGYVSHNNNWDMAGNPNAGTFQVEQGGGRGQTTYDIFEPTFYFVIPKSSTVASTNHPDGAKITEFTTDDGHTVVKFDYTGSGVTIDTSKGTGTYGTVTLANKPDALPGNYPYYMYIVSPKTKIANNTPAVDTSYVENNPNAYLMGDGGKGNWTITTASSFFNTSLAKGNEDVDAITKGTSDDQGDPTLNFFDSIVYTSLADNAKDSNASVAINLPTVGDSKGSQYTFKLTGPIQVPTNYTVVDGQGVAINPTVLYSTQPQSVNNNATSPDTTGYVNADQVTDWSTVRSIVIEIKGIQANTSTGRIPISGTTTDDFKTLAGKTGYLQTIFYGNGAKGSVNSNDASIKITGTSTIKTRFHYVDASGANQYVYLDDLSKTLNDNADPFNNDYPTKLSGFSSVDQAKIPSGYKLVTDASGNTTPTIIDGTGDGKAQFGTTTKYFYDGDFVQYELVGNVNAQVEYVDDDNNGAVVGTSTTISGTSGGTANWTANNIPTGYKLANGQAANGTYQFTNDTDQTVKIHLVHIVDQTTTTTTRTINYTGVAGDNPDANIKQLNWKVDTDQVTGVTTYTPTGNYPEVTSPTVPGYTPDKATVSAGTDTVTTTQPINTSVTVTYSAENQSAKVEYVDDDNNGVVVGTPTAITGKTDGTANWDTRNKPTGYHLAAGQAASGTYKFTADKDQIVKIHLTHIVSYSNATTTRMINYVVDDSNYTGQVPETQTQKINWKITTDEATGETVATPQGAYYQQTAPTILGYKTTPESVSQLIYGPVTSVPKNETVTIHYTAENQSAQVEYVDDNNNGAVVGTPTTITGKTSGTANWNTDDKPAGYHLAAGQAASGTYQFTNGTDQTVKIHLTHIVDYSTAMTTRTINYVVDDPNYTGQVPETQTQKINWKITTDEATGETVATPQGAYYAQTAPTITGYTADPASVALLTYGAVSGLPENQSATVHYTADNQNAKVEYVDDNNSGAVVGTPTTITGKTSGTANWNTDDKPAGYHLAAGQAASGTYQFTNDTDQTVKIHLIHIVDYSKATTTRTINYVVDDPNYTGQVPETQTQKINWKITTDEATGETVATPQGAYYEQIAPTISGYTAGPASVGQEALGAVTTLPQDETVTVHYTAGDQSAKVEYVDDDNNGAIVGTPTTLTGKTSGTADWNTNDKPAGYHLAAGQAVNGTYQFTADKDQTVKIHLTHIVDYSKAITTRTINYVVDDPNYTGQVPETQTQKINWKITTDEATGETVVTPQGAYYEQTAPTITGYTADPASVGQEAKGAVTALPQDETVTVHYTAGNQSAKVEYVDDDNNGAVVGTPTTLTGKTSGTADWNTNDKPAGYHLAAGQAANGTYQFTNESNQTVKIHLTHIVDYSTATTTRTITYKVDDPNYTGQVPETQTQKIDWKITTDEATGQTVATPQGAYYAQTAPTIIGYTAEPASVVQEVKGAVTTLPANENVTVTYKANAQTAQVEYVDDDNGGALVGTPTTITGVTNGTATWNTNNIPAHYTLASGQPTSGTYTFRADKNVPIIIHLNHKLDFTTTTSTRTIHYVVDDPSYTGPVPAPTIQTITWKVVTDEVTGNSVATPQGAYYEQSVPELVGYTATPAKVNQQAVGSVVAHDVPMYNEDEVVTYTPINSNQPGQPNQQTQPGQPNQPVQPTEPLQPTQPIEPTQPTTPSTPDPGTVVNKTTTPGKGITETTNPGTATSRTTAKNGNGSQSSFGTEYGSAGTLRTSTTAQNDSVGNQSDSSTNQQNNQQKLPQTNEQSHSEVGLGLLGLLTSMLGLVGLKRRKRDDE